MKPTYCADKKCPCHATVRGMRVWCCKRCKRNGPMPLTIVPPSEAVRPEVIAARIQQTRMDHSATLSDYHKIWYESGHTWAFTSFLGIALMKNPNDLWIYQDLLTNLRPTTIIETGTFAGGSALWFAYLMDMLRIRGGRVITIDVDNHLDRKRWATPHPRITFLRGSSTDPKTVAKAMKLRRPGPVLISLDADHSEAHVLRELELYAPHTNVGDWIVVEDTNIGWVGENGAGDRGARGGVEEYFKRHPGEFAQDILCERYLLTMNPGGWLFRTSPHRETAK